MSEFNLEARVGRIEEKLREDFATRNHVRDAVSGAIAPFTQSVSKLESAVIELGHIVKGIDSRTEKINQQHDKLLADRAEHEKAENEAKIALLEAEKEELKNNTFIKRYGGGITVGVGATVLFKFLLDTVLPLLQAYNQLPKK